MATTTTTTTLAQPSTHHNISSNDTTLPIPRGSTTSNLTFYGPPADGSTPWNYVETPPEGLPQRNYTENPHSITLQDIRDRETDFDLDTHAFSVVQNVSSEEKDFTDDEHIQKVYYPEVIDTLLRHAPGKPNRVLLFDHTIRRSHPSAPRAPVQRCHVDQTAKSAAARVRYHLPDEADELLKGRYRIINVWRPLHGPVRASPLGFAASDSVPDDDFVPIEHRYPHRTGETAGIKHSVGQKWFYLSGMKNDERLFLQCFDSEKGARVPHTAFTDPHTPEGAPGRESIEVRAIVFG